MKAADNILQSFLLRLANRLMESILHAFLCSMYHQQASQEGPETESVTVTDGLQNEEVAKLLSGRCSVEVEPMWLLEVEALPEEESQSPGSDENGGEDIKPVGSSEVPGQGIGKPGSGKSTGKAVKMVPHLAPGHNTMRERLTDMFKTHMTVCTSAQRLNTCDELRPYLTIPKALPRPHPLALPAEESPLLLSDADLLGQTQYQILAKLLEKSVSGALDSATEALSVRCWVRWINTADFHLVCEISKRLADPWLVRRHTCGTFV